MKGRPWATPGFWVFLTLLGSYAFTWQARDWNTASRLMLTYALGDRRTIVLDGLNDQTGDIAHFQGHYYTDKLPGFSITALPAYKLARVALGVPPHPLGAKGFAHWWPDYVVTLAVSGLATAGLGALLATWATRLGCGPRRAALVGLAYGLATPASVYATLAYGHPLTALALAGSLFLVVEDVRARLRAVVAGFLASFATTVELQVAPVSALIGLVLLGRIATGRRTFAEAVGFAMGALPPMLGLVGYNVLAFDNPLDMGYFHHATARFAEVHSKGNPLGLRPPAWDKAVPLLVGGYRGLLFYAPILVLAPLGWGWLFASRRRTLAIGSLGACLATFAVNLSYPEWTGGWSTGPRLLLPLLPFAMLAVAAALARWRGWVIPATGLALVGFAIVFLFQGVGGRLPDQLGPEPLLDPLGRVVWPLWRGDPIPSWWIGDRFARNLAGQAWSTPIAALPASWQWVQFAPLLAFQAGMVVAIAGMFRRPAIARRPPAPAGGGAPATRDPA